MFEEEWGYFLGFCGFVYDVLKWFVRNKIGNICVIVNRFLDFL